MSFIKNAYDRIRIWFSRLGAGDLFIGGVVLLAIVGIALGLIFRPDEDIAQSAAFDPIRYRGVLRAAVRADVPGMGYAAEDGIVGLEADIARAVSLRIFGEDSDNVEFVAVTANTRGPRLLQNTVDIACAMFVPGASTSYEYSQPYYYDPVYMIVLPGTIAAPDELSELSRVGVLSRAGARGVAQKYYDDRKIRVQEYVFESILDMKEALMTDRIDAFVLEATLLDAYVDESCAVLEQPLGEVPYAIAVRPEEPEMLRLCNEVVAALREAGSLDALVEAWGLEPSAASGQR